MWLCVSAWAVRRVSYYFPYAWCQFPRNWISMSVSKKLNIDVDNYDDLCDPDDMGSYRNELSEYVNLKVEKNTDSWRDNKMFLPKMYRMACRFLCGLASEASSDSLQRCRTYSWKKNELPCQWIFAQQHELSFSDCHCSTVTVLVVWYLCRSSSSCYDDTNYLVRSSSRSTAHFHPVRFCASLFEVVIDIPISPQSSCMLSSHLLLGRPRDRVRCSCPYSKLFGSRRLSIRVIWP